MTIPSPGDQKNEILAGVRAGEEFEILDESRLYADSFLGLSMLNCRLPGGGENRQLRIALPPVVAVVALLPANGDGGRRVVLIEQVRPAVGGRMFEIPAGHIEEGESPRQAAFRELEEETGYRAGSMESLAVRYTIPGMSFQLMHYFLAADLDPGRQRLEESEHIVVHEIELDSLVEEILNGSAEEPRVVDNKTHLALLHVAMLNSQRKSAGAGGLP